MRYIGAFLILSFLAGMLLHLYWITFMMGWDVLNPHPNELFPIVQWFVNAWKFLTTKSL